MTPKTTWLLIDIGDVLLLKNENNEKSFTELLANKLGIGYQLADAINKIHYTTMEDTFVSEKQFVSELKVKLDYDAPEDIFAYFERAYDTQKQPNTKFLKFLNEVRAEGVKTAVLSNTIAIYQRIQERAGISKAAGFDPILFSWDVHAIKPNKEIYELALEKLGARPEEVLFIDDKAGHLEGAKKVGVRTYLFENTDEAIKEIRRVLNVGQ